jgi:hypothetical protein
VRNAFFEDETLGCLSSLRADVPELVTQLVERFDRNRDSYLAGGINETQLRREFIDPFFSRLGWDNENRQGYSPAYREVILEDSLKVGGETKAPDYCFCISGMREFLVETKKLFASAGGLVPLDFSRGRR